MSDDLSHLDESARRVIKGRRTHYARRALVAMDPLSPKSMTHREIVQQVLGVTRRGKPMPKNEVQVWKDAAALREQGNLMEAGTRRMVAEHAIEIQEQMQAEAQREHDRKLALQRLKNEHALEKLATVDVSKETARAHELAKMKLDAGHTLQKGWFKGMIVGTPIGLTLGFAAGLTIGLLF